MASSRRDQTTFTCTGSATDYGKCCVARGTEVACFFSDYTFLTIHTY